MSKTPEQRSEFRERLDALWLAFLRMTYALNVDEYLLVEAGTEAVIKKKLADLKESRGESVDDILETVEFLAERMEGSHADAKSVRPVVERFYQQAKAELETR